MNFNTRKTITFIASTFVGMAAGTLTSMVLKQNVNPVKISQKVATVVGSFAIGAMVQDKAESYIGDICNQAFDIFDTIKNASLDGEMKDDSESQDDDNEEKDE